MKSTIKRGIRQVCGSSAKDILSAVESDTTIVSFDVFDTLIVRSCGAPERVFSLVEDLAHEKGLLDSSVSFADKRIQAENFVRSLAGANCEVTLDDIYTQLQLTVGTDVQEIEKLELACELALCEPNNSVVEQLNTAAKTYRVVIISDTYLPKWFVRLLLDECGISGYEKLYVSSETREMKRDGKLFQRVFLDMGVAPGQMLHVGDHPLADWVAPKKLGMSSYLLGVQSSSVGEAEATAASGTIDVRDVESDKAVADSLKAVQTIGCGLLQAVVETCNEHEIPYFLVEGSCLGAIRHNGFVPWDDDIDVAIPATMHREFEEAFNASHGERYRAVKAFDASGEELIRVLDTSVYVRGGLFEGRVYEHPMIDVFLICGLPSNTLRAKIHYTRIMARQKLYKLADPTMILDRERGLIGTVVARIARRTGGVPFLDRGRELQRLGRAMCKYDFSQSEKCFCITWYGKREIMPTAVYGLGREGTFDGMSVVIPSKAEEYLERLYGDYMTLPPEEERKPKHHLEIVEKA